MPAVYHSAPPAIVSLYKFSNRHGRKGEFSPTELGGCQLKPVLPGFRGIRRTSTLTPCAASISAASSEVPTIFEKVAIDTSVPAKKKRAHQKTTN